MNHKAKTPSPRHRQSCYIAKIATGEMKDEGKDKAAQSLGRRGGKARAEKMPPERRAEIAMRNPAKAGIWCEKIWNYLARFVVA